MGKILRGLSDESVWLKSLAEHDNVDKFVQLTCSASDFNHTLSSQIPFILHHKTTIKMPLMPKRKRTHGKSLFFPGELGNGWYCRTTFQRAKLNIYMKTPACRTSRESMGGENSQNDFDLNLVTLTYNCWPWPLWHLTLTYDLWPWPLWPWPWTIFSDTRLKTGIFTFFDLGDLDLWPMTLTFELVRDMLDINVLHVTCIGICNINGWEVPIFM